MLIDRVLAPDYAPMLFKPTPDPHSACVRPDVYASSAARIFGNQGVYPPAVVFVAQVGRRIKVDHGEWSPTENGSDVVGNAIHDFGDNIISPNPLEITVRMLT